MGGKIRMLFSSERVLAFLAPPPPYSAHSFKQIRQSAFLFLGAVCMYFFPFDTLSDEFFLAKRFGAAARGSRPERARQKNLRKNTSSSLTSASIDESHLTECEDWTVPIRRLRARICSSCAWATLGGTRRRFCGGPPLVVG